ncbi:TPA: CRISPR-associated endoribonuclease Cas6 [bacterium]|nr:CRISPR-associated endoribonuclease Cas6 [bacterium]
MRIKITIDVGKGISIPINYNYFLASVIYRFLDLSNPEYAYFLHEDGYGLGDKKFKLFTFSQLMAQKREIRGNYIQFKSPLTWFVSSPQEEFLGGFAASLLDQRVILINDIPLQVKDVDIPKIPHFQERMYFRCLSPITMSTKREFRGEIATHYLLPDESDFSELIRQNLIRKYETIYGRKPRDDSFRMEFDADYISKQQGRVTRLVRYKDIDIRGVLCPFRAFGSPELMFIGYECGFGDKNSAGFGMVEVF